MERTKNIRTFIIKIIGWVAIQAIIWNIPPVAPLTEVGVHSLAVFAGVIYTLCVMPERYGIGMLMAPVLMAFTGGYPSMNAALSAAFANDTFIMIFSIWLVSGIVITSGLAKTLALKMINAKWTAGKPWRLTFAILLAAAVLSLFINALIVVAILCDLIIEIYRNLKLKYSRWTLFVLCDMAVISITAQNILPFQAGPVFIYGLLSAIDPAYTIAVYGGANIVLQFVMLVALFAVAMILTVIFCRGCVDELRNYVPSDEKYPLTPGMKKALGILAFFVVVQLVPMILPAGALKNFLNLPGLTGWGCIAACIAMCLFEKDGKSFVTFDELMGSMNWYALFMLFGIGTVMGVVNAESSGVIPWLSGILEPICTGFGPYGAFAVLIVLLFLLTNFTDNIAIMFVAIPIAYIVGMATGINPGFLSAAAYSSIQLGIVLPSASPHVAMVFAKRDTGYVKTGAAIVWFAVRGIIGLVVIITLGWLLQGIF